MPRPSARIATVVVALAASLAAAHDFWVQPHAFRVAPDTLVRLDLRVGDEFPGEQVARKPERIASFTAVGPGTAGAATPIIGQDGRAPAGLARFSDPGLYRVAYTSRAANIELEAAKFEAYLREEGLEHIIEWRAEHSEGAEPGREAYARYAKALVLVGGAPAAGFDAPVGLKLEIVPETDPFALAPGGDLVFRVLLDGKPAPGVLVGARSPTERKEVQAVRTDEAGRARLVLASSGMWLLHTVHMARAAEDAPVDWESSWASLTFAIGPPTR